MIVNTQDINRFPVLVDNKLILIRREANLDVYSTKDFKLIRSVALPDSKYYTVGSCNNVYYFAIQNQDCSHQLYSLELDFFKVRKVNIDPSESPSLIEGDDHSILVLLQNNRVAEIQLGEQEKFTDFSCFENRRMILAPASNNKYIVGSGGGKRGHLCIYDRERDQETIIKLAELFERGPANISRFRSFSGKFYTSNKHQQFFCLNPETESINWIVDDWSSVSWCTQNGKALTVFKNKLKILDLETGELDFEQELDWPSEWGNEELLLFQSAVSDTHFWCAFMGKGLCAINLETKEIDWHDYNGSTVNVPPVIIGNRVFIWLLNGGIGIGESDKEQFLMLEVQQ